MSILSLLATITQHDLIFRKNIKNIKNSIQTALHPVIAKIGVANVLKDPVFWPPDPNVSKNPTQDKVGCDYSSLGVVKSTEAVEAYGISACSLRRAKATLCEHSDVEAVPKRQGHKPKIGLSMQDALFPF